MRDENTNGNKIFYDSYGGKENGEEISNQYKISNLYFSVFSKSTFNLKNNNYEYDLMKATSYYVEKNNNENEDSFQIYFNGYYAKFQ